MTGRRQAASDLSWPSATTPRGAAPPIGRSLAFDSLEYRENYRPVDSRDLAKNLKGQ